MSRLNQHSEFTMPYRNKLVCYSISFFHFPQADSDEDLTPVQPRRRVPAANNHYQDDYNSKCLKITFLCYDTLDCSQHSVFMYFHLIIERADRITRELDASANWKPTPHPCVLHACFVRFFFRVCKCRGCEQSNDTRTVTGCGIC